jgi:hypothetical protein
VKIFLFSTDVYYTLVASPFCGFASLLPHSFVQYNLLKEYRVRSRYMVEETSKGIKTTAEIFVA